MFLLIRNCSWCGTQFRTSLHSTMFLLILTALVCSICRFLHFTFHNVSINTEFHIHLLPLRSSLHSTLFLLIRLVLFNLLCLFCFTFHNVSINTEIPPNYVNVNLTLHSTMFLLIPLWCHGWYRRTALYIPQCFY